ncbi:MAG: hypothetical protein JWL64_2613 [Frankiales bacterium]|nr:hypothetical protein [Frankiales bacterium]
MSESPGPLVFRPVRLTRVCWGVAAFVLVGFVGIGASLRATGDGAATFGLADQVAMGLMGVLIAGVVLLFTRARVEADTAGIRVRGVMGDKYFPWQVVVGVRLDDGDSWASLDLHDDERVALLAVQSNDGDRATEAVLALRRLLAVSRTRPATPPPSAP